jgi:hypothetical protein
MAESPEVLLEASPAESLGALLESSAVWLSQADS